MGDMMDALSLLGSSQIKLAVEKATLCGDKGMRKYNSSDFMTRDAGEASHYLHCGCRLREKTNGLTSAANRFFRGSYRNHLPSGNFYQSR